MQETLIPRSFGESFHNRIRKALALQEAAVFLHPMKNVPGMEAAIDKERGSMNS